MLTSCVDRMAGRCILGHHAYNYIRYPSLLSHIHNLLVIGGNPSTVVYILCMKIILFGKLWDENFLLEARCDEN